MALPRITEAILAIFVLLGIYLLQLFAHLCLLSRHLCKLFAHAVFALLPLPLFLSLLFIMSAI
jgi:hypothetical protein